MHDNEKQELRKIEVGSFTILTFYGSGFTKIEPAICVSFSDANFKSGEGDLSLVVA